MSGGHREASVEESSDDDEPPEADDSPRVNRVDAYLPAEMTKPLDSKRNEFGQTIDSSKPLADSE